MTIEDKVIAKISARRELGLKKYGVGLERTDLTAEQWLTHFQEEMMDGALYAERAIEEMEKLKQILRDILETEVYNCLPRNLRCRIIGAVYPKKDK